MIPVSIGNAEDTLGLSYSTVAILPRYPTLSHSKVTLLPHRLSATVVSATNSIAHTSDCNNWRGSKYCQQLRMLCAPWTAICQK